MDCSLTPKLSKKNCEYLPEYYKPNISRKIRILSLGQKNNILIKEIVIYAWSFNLWITSSSLSLLLSISGPHVLGVKCLL